MNRKEISLVVLVTLAVLIIIIAYFAYFLTRQPQKPQIGNGLEIAVTFYSLKEDVGMLTCKGDNVFSVAPSGVDPHEYQLSPADIEKIKSANIIISTAHTPFESQIRDLVSKGEVKAVLIEIPEIPGIKVKNNPATGQPNYHWLIYDPSNYKLFLDYVEKQLEKLRPSCAQEYRSTLENLIGRIEKIQTNITRRDICAVATSPPAQYAVEWTGINVKYLLLKEENLPATPQDLAAIDSSIRNGECSLIVIVGSPETPLAQKALEYVKKYNVQYIVIPDPISPDSTLNKISAVVQALNSLKG